MDNRTLTTAVLVRRMAGLVKPLTWAYVFAISFAVLGFVTTLLIPGVIIDLGFVALTGQRPHWLFLGLLVVLGLLRGVFRYGEHYFGHYVAFRTLYDCRCLVFDKMKRLAPAKLDGQDSGQLLKMIGEDIEAMEVFFAHTVPPIMTATVVTILLSFYYAGVSWGILGIALLTYGLLAVYLPQVFAKRLQPLLSAQSQSRKAYMSLFSDSLRGMKDLMQFNQVVARFDMLQGESLAVNDCEQEVAKANYMQLATTFLLVGLSIVTVAALAFGHVQAGAISLKTATMVTVVFATSFAPYLELSRLPLGFKRAINAGREVFSLLDESEMDKTGQPLSELLEHIALSDIGFTYDGRDQAVFQQLSQSFEPGKIIGLIGPSGSGKSTLMKLIMKWYPIHTGQITLNHQSLSNLSAPSVQERIAYIPQMPQIFSQTIRENLILGRTGISDAQILAAAEKCQIKDVILGTEKGLDTLLNSEQAIFSAGQLQRLELTRALLKDADCYIFDEPTSHLDSLNEAAFLQVIKAHCKGYVFLISHRVSTVSCSDVIYKVEGQGLVKQD